MKESWIEFIITNTAGLGIGFFLGAICEPIKKAISKWIDKSFVNKPSKQAKIIIEAIKHRQDNEKLLSLMKCSNGFKLMLISDKTREICPRLDFKTIIGDLSQVEELGYIKLEGNYGSDKRYTIVKQI